MDYALFRLINDWAGRGGWLDGVMVAVARYAPLLFGAALVWLWAGGGRSPAERLAALRALAAAGLALAVGQAVIRLAPRARPSASHPVHLLIAPSADPSFPSDHALAAFAIAAAVLPAHRRLGLGLLALAAVLAVARVFVGAHYPLDVLGGAAAGAAVGTLVRLGDGWLAPAAGLAARWSDGLLRRRPRRG